MPIYDLEYVIAVIQSGQFSVAAKEHRNNANPQLHVNSFGVGTRWEIPNLFSGAWETEQFVQRNRIDFYWEHNSLKQVRGTLPPPTSPATGNHRFAGLDPKGSEHPGGKLINSCFPIVRIRYVTNVRFVCHTGNFVATANEATLHLDYEVAPYILGQIHFGIEAEYQVQAFNNQQSSYVEFEVDGAVYADLYSELMSV